MDVLITSILPFIGIMLSLVIIHEAGHYFGLSEEEIEEIEERFWRGEDVADLLPEESDARGPGEA